MQIVTTSVESDTNLAAIQLERQQSDSDGAVGGQDDDSVFVDEGMASTSKALMIQSSPHRSSCDNDEEVDDIELILSSEDKEYPQEDMVSISYYEPWQMCGQSGTPILVNFNNISSDNEGDESREQLSPTEIDPDQFYNAIKENVAQQQLSLESSDSLSLGDNLKYSYDFNTKSSSLDKESDPKTCDENGLIRDESFDTFEQVNEQSARLSNFYFYFYLHFYLYFYFIIPIDILTCLFILNCCRPAIHRPWADVGQITMFSKRQIYQKLASLKKVCRTKADETHAQIQLPIGQSCTEKQWDDI